VVLAIGSAQYSHSFRNPFTLGERIEMIYRTLRAEKLLDRVIVCSVPDTDGRHAIWVQMVIACCPSFKRVYTNDPLTRLLFEEAGFEVRGIPFFERERYEGTAIRLEMAKNGDWRSRVPPTVAEVIEKIAGVERVARLYRMEAEKSTFY